MSCENVVHKGPTKCCPLQCSTPKTALLGGGVTVGGREGRGGGGGKILPIAATVHLFEAKSYCTFFVLVDTLNTTGGSGCYLQLFNMGHP